MERLRSLPAAAVLALGIAGCSAGGSVNVVRAPDTSALAAPFSPLTFDVEVIGPEVIDGFECPVGILTSASEMPSAARRGRAGVQSASGGCDPALGFPVASPLPNPPTPAPSPLGADGMGTGAIGQFGARMTLPPVAGWTGALSFPPCPNDSSCDAGTSNGTIALLVSPSTTAASYAFSLEFAYVGPETIVGAAPSAAEHPSPHMWLLYGAEPAPGASPVPIQTWVSGSPVTLGFPAVHVIPPPGSGIAPGSLRLHLSQVLTPPSYEEAIYEESVAGGFLPIPLVSSASPAYAPYTTASNAAVFALPSTPFPFQTDFTAYEFTISSSS